MRVSTKHEQEQEIVLSNFLGGLDKSLPPFAIDANALIDATNFYYDPLSGYLRTRHGLKRYSASALPASAEVIGVYEYVKAGVSYVILAGANQNLYYLDGTKTPVLIGALSGSKRPSFSTLAGKLVVCSGGALQTWGGPGTGVTRFYFPAAEVAAVNPTYDAGWGYTSETVRRRLTSVKGASAITGGTQIGPWTAGQNALDRQYVSDPMSQGIVFNLSTTVKMQLMAREYAIDDNATSRLGIRIVSNDGITVLATLLTVANYGPTTEYLETGERNKTFADSDAITSSYTTVGGERLVIEIGHSDATGTTPEASSKWGENATDLPVDETQTTDGAGWIEFSNTITFLLTTSSPTMDYISDHARKDVARIVGCGNTTNRDRIYLSGSNDPANWTFNASPESDAKYFDAGYQDGLTAIGIGVYRGDIFIFKADDNFSAKMLYRSYVNDVSTAWWCRELSKYHGILSPHFGMEVNGEFFFIDREGAKTLTAVEGYSEFPFDVSPIAKAISEELRSACDATGFTILDPVFGTIMVKPTINYDYFYVMNFLTGKWTLFKYALNIKSGAYAQKKMLLGATDGFVYEYDTTLDKDNAVAYIMSVETKWFNLSPPRREITKDKELDILGITDGALTIQVKVKGTTLYSNTFSFAQTWWDWATVNNTEEADWTEDLTKLVYSTLYDRNPVQGDYLSFGINITSGLCSLAEVRLREAVAGRNI